MDISEDFFLKLLLYLGKPFLLFGKIYDPIPQGVQAQNKININLYP